MSTVTVIPDPEEPDAPKIDDAAFAAGQTVGRFESHMSECQSKHVIHDAAESNLEARIATLEATTAATAVVAVAAVDAAEDAEEAAEDAEEAAEETEADATPVIEMEMPEVPVEHSEKHEKKKGFFESLW